MTVKERAPVNVPHIQRQISGIQEVCAKEARLPQRGPLDISSMSDEDFQKLMAPCKGPQDDPTRGDIR